jgi:hypothetical protein
MVLQFTNGEKAKAAGLGLTLDKHAFTADEVYHKVSPPPHSTTLTYTCT